MAASYDAHNDDATMKFPGCGAPDRRGSVLASRDRQDSVVTYDLVIRRSDPADPIDRQEWLSFAADAVALVQLSPDREQENGIDFPAFGLLGLYGHPVLFWRDGQVAVRYADDEHLSDVEVVARHLNAELVPTGTGT